jgi:periplasmic divalent cation tolerance protein
MKSSVVVFITTPNKKEAEKISKVLLKKRITACVNIIDNIESHFWWEGKIQKENECLLIAKTLNRGMKKLIKLVTSIHPYKVPEIIALPIKSGYKTYLEWIEKESSGIVRC